MEKLRNCLELSGPVVKDCLQRLIAINKKFREIEKHDFDPLLGKAIGAMYALYDSMNICFPAQEWSASAKKTELLTALIDMLTCFSVIMDAATTEFVSRHTNEFDAFILSADSLKAKIDLL